MGNPNISAKKPDLTLREKIIIGLENSGVDIPVHEQIKLIDCLVEALQPSPTIQEGQ